MKLNDFQEILVRLFLRLNGYITTDLIIHSDVKGKNKTQIDVIGVRFPYHQQLDREVASSDYLQIPNETIDIIIGEVKGKNVRINFNSSLYSEEQTIEKLLKWIGVLNDKEIDSVKSGLISCIRPKEVQTPNEFNILEFKTELGPTVTFRPMLFAPDSESPAKNQIRFVPGKLMIDYIYDCLCPSQERNSCSVIYDYNGWGIMYSDIVKHFKENNSGKPPNLVDLYNKFVTI